MLTFFSASANVRKIFPRSKKVLSYNLPASSGEASSGEASNDSNEE